MKNCFFTCRLTSKSVTVEDFSSFMKIFCLDSLSRVSIKSFKSDKKGDISSKTHKKPLSHHLSLKNLLFLFDFLIKYAEKCFISPKFQNKKNYLKIIKEKNHEFLKTKRKKKSRRLKPPISLIKTPLFQAKTGSIIVMTMKTIIVIFF